MGVIDYSLRRRLVALEAAVSGSGAAPAAMTTQAGAQRPLDTVFSLPCPKDYFVNYRWDADSPEQVTARLRYGDGDTPDDTWTTIDAYDRVLAHHTIELQGRVPAGKSVVITIDLGEHEPPAAAIETPLS
jgi:hypothetical protein